MRNRLDAAADERRSSHTHTTWWISPLLWTIWWNASDITMCSVDETPAYDAILRYHVTFLIQSQAEYLQFDMCVIDPTKMSCHSRSRCKPLGWWKMQMCNSGQWNSKQINGARKKRWKTSTSHTLQRDGLPRWCDTIAHFTCALVLFCLL